MGYPLGYLNERQNTVAKRRDKGLGSVYQTADGTWVGSLELPPDPFTGKRRRKTVKGKTKSVVVRKLGELRRTLETTGNLPTESLTLENWLETWLNTIAAPRLKPSTLRGYKSNLRQYVIPVLGKRRLDKLTPADLLRLYTRITDPKNGLGLSTTTARQTHAILRRALGDAMKHGHVTNNVATLVDAPKRAIVERPVLTADQARHFLYYHRNRPYVVRYMLGLLTGCRQGEALGLTCDNVTIYRDSAGTPVGGVLTYAWALQQIPWTHGCNGVCGHKRGADCPERRADIEPTVEALHVQGAMWLLRPKTAASYREVAMPPVLAAALDTYMNGRTSGLVFLQDHGAPIGHKQDWETWKAWLSEAGLPRVPIHSMRHTTATLLYSLGVDEVTRMAIMGHTSAVTTRIYTHRDMTLQESALGKLAGLISDN